jgi:hypothetical protein
MVRQGLWGRAVVVVGIVGVGALICWNRRTTFLIDGCGEVLWSAMRVLGSF